MGILNLMSNKSYGIYNKDLAKKIGLHEAILLGELCGEYDYWESRGDLTPDGWFFSTVENVENNTTLTKYQQSVAIKHLKEAGLVEQVNKGLPQIRYFKLNEEKILQLVK